MDDDLKQHIVDSLEKDGAGYSWFADHTDATPSHCQTFGWSISFDSPELIGFGSMIMALRVLPGLFNGLLDALDDGYAMEDGQIWPMMWGDHPVVGRRVHPSNVSAKWFEAGLYARELAGISGPMPAYQLFWPDEAGRLPWDEGCSKRCRELQPLLYRPSVGAVS